MFNSGYTLLVTVGSSPAIVTETLWALHTYEKLHVNRVVVLTTTHGWDKLNDGILRFSGDRLGAYYQLCTSLGWPPHATHFEGAENGGPVCDALGRHLSDIRSAEDDRRFAEAVFRTVKNLTAEGAPPVIGLLSGGRKTMGTHLASVFQLLARPQDRLIHVLVNDPYDRIPEFYFPSQPHQVLRWQNVTVMAADAKITLLDSAFARLRDLLPAKITAFSSYDQLLSTVDERLAKVGREIVSALWIDFDHKGIAVNDPSQFIRLNPRSLSIFAFFAACNHHQGRIVKTTWGDVIKNPNYLHMLHRLYRLARYGSLEHMHPENRRDEEKDLESKDSWAKWEHWREGSKLIKKDFSVKRNQLLKELREGFLEHKIGDESDVMHLFQYDKPVRDSLKTLHTIPLKPEAVEWIGMESDFWEDTKSE